MSIVGTNDFIEKLLGRGASARSESS
jgi:hypothetical protein